MDKEIFLTSDLEERIHEMLVEIQPSFAFEEGIDFVENGYLDSFDVVTLVAVLEEDFGIIVSALEIVPENFGSVASIAELVRHSPRREA